MTRISTGSYSDTWALKQYYVPSGQIIQQTQGSANKFTRTVTRSDIVKSPTPRPVPLRPLAYSCIVEELQQLGGYIKFATAMSGGVPTSVKEENGNLGPLVSPISVPSYAVDTKLRDAAIARMLANVKNQKFNAPLALGEISKTVKLVAGTATRIYNGVRDCKHGKFADAARGFGLWPHRRNSRRAPTTQQAHEAFLELQYGWKPLMQDVKGATESLADSLYKEPGRLWMKVQGQARYRNRSSRTLSVDMTAYSVEDIVERMYRVIAYVKPNNPYLVQASSLGITNPLALAWELQPWSFVADWFIPIGDYLNLLDATLGWDYSTGCIIEVLHNRTENPRWVGTHAQFIRGWLTSGGGRRYRFTRTPSTSFPTLPLPRIKNPFSTTHVANAIALLRGLF